MGSVAALAAAPLGAGHAPPSRHRCALALEAFLALLEEAQAFLTCCARKEG